MTKPLPDSKLPSGAVLTRYLRKLAMEVHAGDLEGMPVTKAQALAKLVWERALGTAKIDPKTGKEEVTKPEVWAVELLFDRIEGKIPIAVAETSTRSLTEKVSDLGKAKINALTKAPSIAKTAEPPGEDGDHE